MNNLKKNREFQIIYNLGKKEFGYYSLIFFKKNNSQLLNFGFVASKKIGNAVSRNRIKRLFKEYVRLNYNNIDFGFDIIFVAKKKSGEDIKIIDYNKIKKDLDKVLSRAKLLKL
ncbi:MAG: ribonuclease P protein component [Fusobacteriaceae bacterium]